MNVRFHVDMVTSWVEDEFRMVIKLEPNYVCVKRFQYTPVGQSEEY